MLISFVPIALEIETSSSMRWSIRSQHASRTRTISRTLIFQRDGRWIPFLRLYVFIIARMQGRTLLMISSCLVTPWQRQLRVGRSTLKAHRLVYQIPISIAQRLLLLNYSLFIIGMITRMKASREILKFKNNSMLLKCVRGYIKMAMILYNIIDAYW